MTSESSWQDEVGKRVIVPQIIVAALAAGCLVFLAVAVWIQGRKGGLHWDVTPMTLVLVLFAVADGAARLVVPPLVVRSGRRAILQGSYQPPVGGTPEQRAAFEEFLARTGDAGRLLAVFQTRLILAAALLEGVAFFAIVTYLVEGNGYGLAIALAMVVAILLHLPTRSGVIHWIEDQIEQMRRDA